MHVYVASRDTCKGVHASHCHSRETYRSAMIATVKDIQLRILAYATMTSLPPCDILNMHYLDTSLYWKLFILFKRVDEY